MVCIGEHARGLSDGVLPHSIIRINGVDHSECGMAMALAGWYNIPCVFVSGDNTITAQVREHIPNIEVAVIKKALSPYAARTKAPAKSREMIRKGVTNGLRRRKEIPPYKIPGPYEISAFAATPQTWSPPLRGYNIVEVLHEMLVDAFDYDLQQQHPWPLEPHDPVGNKHIRAAQQKTQA